MNSSTASAIDQHQTMYALSTGASVSLLCPYATPIEEYRLAFADRAQLNPSSFIIVSTKAI